MHELEHMVQVPWTALGPCYGPVLKDANANDIVDGAISINRCKCWFPISDPDLEGACPSGISIVAYEMLPQKSKYPGTWFAMSMVGCIVSTASTTDKQ